MNKSPKRVFYCSSMCCNSVSVHVFYILVFKFAQISENERNNDYVLIGRHCVNHLPVDDLEKANFEVSYLGKKLNSHPQEHQGKILLSFQLLSAINFNSVML